MSQAKVDKYKNEKANRKKTNARNKVKRVIARIVAAAAVVALVGWGGYSGYQYYETSGELLLRRYQCSQRLSTGIIYRQ